MPWLALSKCDISHPPGAHNLRQATYVRLCHCVFGQTSLFLEQFPRKF